MYGVCCARLSDGWQARLNAQIATACELLTQVLLSELQPDSTPYYDPHASIHGFPRSIYPTSHGRSIMQRVALEWLSETSLPLKLRYADIDI